MSEPGVKVIKYTGRRPRDYANCAGVGCAVAAAAGTSVAERRILNGEWESGRKWFEHI